MLEFDYLSKDDYDRIVRVGGVDVPCYSKEKIKALTGAKVSPSHEARVYSEKEMTPNEDGSQKKSAANRIGSLRVRAREFGISKVGGNNPILYKTVGYLPLADGSYVALCVSRVPFLALASGVTAAILAVSAIFLVQWIQGMGDSNDGPPVIEPDHPLPDVDSGAVPDQGDDGYGGTPGEVPEGGGRVPMVYKNAASYYLNSRHIQIYFKNPTYSSHDIVVSLYVLDQNGNEYLLAETGRIPVGYSLAKISPVADAPILSTGVYDALYRVVYYDPYTGVRAAHIQSDIKIELSVKP